MIQLEQLHFSDYRILYYIDEYHSLTRTAEKLFVTQPAISARLKFIEELCGEPAVFRAGKEMYLTEIGKILKENYSVLLQLNKTNKDKINDYHGEITGNITLGTSDTLGIHLLPEYIKKFQDLYPKVQLNLTSKPSRIISRDILEGKIDVGIALDNSAQHERFLIEPLMTRKDIIICSPKSVLTKYEKLDLIKLSGVPFISLDTLSQSRFIIEDWFKQANAKLSIRMELGSIEMVKRYVELDFGVSIVPEFSVAKEIKQKSLFGIAIKNKINYQQISFITVKDRYLSKAIWKFKEFVKTEISNTH